MLKKTILIILVVMFLTGCSVDYKVDINNIDKIVETIEFNSESNNDINSIESFEYAIPIDKNSDETVNYNSVKGNDAFYNLVKNENNTKMTLNHTFDIYKYKNIFLPVLCYDYFEAIKDEDFVILSTSNKFKCFESYPELSAVNVIVTSKYKTTENNADEVNDNVYTWHITRENADNKYLYLSIDAKSIDNSKENRIAFIVAVIFVSIAVVVSLFLLIRNKRSDRL